jgi:hypothetical protein
MANWESYCFIDSHIYSTWAWDAVRIAQEFWLSAVPTTRILQVPHRGSETSHEVIFNLFSNHQMGLVGIFFYPDISQDKSTPWLKITMQKMHDDALAICMSGLDAYLTTTAFATVHWRSFQDQGLPSSRGSWPLGQLGGNIWGRETNGERV